MEYEKESSRNGEYYTECYPKGIWRVLKIEGKGSFLSSIIEMNLFINALKLNIHLMTVN